MITKAELEFMLSEVERKQNDALKFFQNMPNTHEALEMHKRLVIEAEEYRRNFIDKIIAYYEAKS